ICSPGRDSILAAMYPKKTDFLYFVARNDGSHQFSKTLKEHNEAVQKYQR
ncbi:MAG TPA: endolytic transglycosylase MltG, partial [Spirochaetota bacterium]|nr:endolytic transglycosylase MltG [Spirochaetota bacterium]